MTDDTKTPFAGAKAKIPATGMFTSMKAAFPDMKFAPQLVLVNGHNIFAVALNTGTHEGTMKMPGMPDVPATPEGLAHAIYDEAIVEADGDKYEASFTVMRFLTEALIYAVGVSTGGDESQRKGVLERLGKMIAEAPPHPIAAAAADASDAKKKQPW